MVFFSFIQDYARAAKSAINFFLAPASSYKVLCERGRFLHNAKKHYQQFIRNTKEAHSSGHSLKHKNLKIISPQEAEKFVTRIFLCIQLCWFKIEHK